MPADPTIRAVAVLDDQLRREMYAFIRRSRRPVTRDEAAASVGISRKLAAFHLDKLVEAGLLRAGSALPSGPGPGKVGRRPKVYEPSGADIRVSIPQRQHDLLADLLLDAVLAESSAEPAREAVLRLARTRGESIGAAERDRARRPGRLGAERALTLACGLLEQYGFEPARESPVCVRLRNCPFHPMAAKSPAMVCGINHAFLAGVVAGLNTPAIQAVLEPRAGECCVELHSAG